MTSRRWLLASMLFGCAPRASRAAGQANLDSMADFVVLDSLRELQTIAPARLAYCKDFSAPGDGGGGHFIWDEQSAAPSNGGTVVASNRMQKGRWLRQGVLGDVDVRWFGAKGDGKSDDTEAIEKAHAYAQPTSTHGSTSSRTVVYPPGRYIYQGTGVRVAQGKLSMRGAVPNSAVIEVRSTSYLVELLGRIETTSVRDLEFAGGRGAFRYSYSGPNVAGLHIFENCTFRNYQECAIGNNSSDHPYLKVRNCTFEGNSNFLPIGIAWGGYIDGLSIEECAFLWNTYHIKLGPRLSGSINISNNDFIKWSKTPKIADIWIVPNSSEKHGVNSGGGIVISQNKFGNENQLPDEARILVAIERSSAGKDRLTRLHSEDWDETTAFLQGVVLERNRFNGIGNLVAPIIRCHINEFRRLEFSGNFLDGGAYTYLCEFEGQPPSNENAYVTKTWSIQLGAHTPGVAPFSKDISNHARGLCDDRFGSMQGSATSLLLGGPGDDVGYIPLVLNEHRSQLNQCSVEGCIGPFGPRSRGSQVLFSHSTGTINFPISSPIAERLSWIEFDVRAPTDLGLEKCLVQVFNTKSSNFALNETISLSDNWQTARIPFIFPNSELGRDWIVCFRPYDFQMRRREILCLGRLSVYHARQAMNSGHIRTVGSGSWNEPHILLGKSHLWIDSSGRLRIKNSQPSNELDGKLVGSQD